MLPRLRQLALGYTEVTDNGLKTIVSGLTGLEVLLLKWTQVSDAGLADLTTLKNLQELGLQETQVTNAGMGQLKNFGVLRKLWLNQTRITDDGLAELRGMSGLRFLDLMEADVTDVGVARLRRDLPKARIVFPVYAHTLDLMFAREKQKSHAPNPTNDRERVIAAIEKLGGEVSIDESRADKPVIGVRLGRIRASTKDRVR